jgi:hypothetical protein
MIGGKKPAARMVTFRRRVKRQHGLRRPCEDAAIRRYNIWLAHQKPLTALEREIAYTDYQLTLKAKNAMTEAEHVAALATVTGFTTERIRTLLNTIEGKLASDETASVFTLPTCRHCGSGTQQIRKGTTRHGKPRFLCKACDRTYSGIPAPVHFEGE